MPVIASIPVVNGVIEAGISAGAEPTLAEDDKLPILKAGSNADKKSFALRWAHNRFGVGNKGMVLNAVVVLMDCNMLASDDGCVKEGNPADALDNSNDDAIKAAISAEGMQKAASMIVATKANWWLTNHHTGGNILSGYAKKVYDTMYAEGNAATDADKKSIHMIGHWCSTKMVLIQAGIPNVIPASVTKTGTARLTLAADAILRFTGPPAGTHKLANAFAAVKRLMNTVYVYICPNAIDLKQVGAPYKAMMSDRAFFHIGSIFLTGQPRSTRYDGLAELVLGRAGTYILAMMPGCTLAKSVHLKESAVESYDDFSPEFKTALGKLKIDSLKSSKAMADKLHTAYQHFSSADQKEVKEQFGVSIPKIDLGIEEEESESSEEEEEEEAEEAAAATSAHATQKKGKTPLKGPAQSKGRRASERAAKRARLGK